MFERLSVRHLRTLKYLHQTQNMGDTANLVNRSQPAVSLQIKDIEEIVGFKIIYHQRGAIFFTEQGEKFARAAETFELQLETIIDELKSDHIATVKAGITQDTFAACGHLLQKLRENRVELIPMNSLAIIQGCADKSLDLGVAKTGTPMSLASKTWGQKLNWASRSSSVSADPDHELVLLSEGCHYHELALHAFEDYKPGTVTLSICDSWNDIAKRLKLGGLTIVPSNWRTKLGCWSGQNQLPHLPASTLNLIVSEQPSKATEWAASQLSSLVSSALDGAQGVIDETWKDNGVKLFD